MIGWFVVNPQYKICKHDVTIGIYERFSLSSLSEKFSYLRLEVHTIPARQFRRVLTGGCGTRYPLFVINFFILLAGVVACYM